MTPTVPLPDRVRCGPAGSAGLLLLDDHRLDGRDDAVGDLDLDHVGPDGADRLVEVDLAAVELEAAGLRIASTMSCAVTEPNRRPSSPAWWAIVSTVLLSRSALSRALGWPR